MKKITGKVIYTEVEKTDQVIEMLLVPYLVREEIKNCSLSIAAIK